MSAEKPTPPVPRANQEVPARTSAPDDAIGYGMHGSATMFPEEAGENVWKRYVSALGRHKVLLVAIMVVGTLAGIAGALLLKPEYLAEATVWVDWEDRPTGEAPSPFAPRELLRSYDWVDLLKSYSVLEHAVHEERLYLRPASPGDTATLRDLRAREGFTPGKYALRVDGDGAAMELVLGDTLVVGSAAPGELIGAQAGLEWTPPVDELEPGRSVEFELIHPRDAARDLAQNLDIQMLEQGNFIRIGLRGRNQARAAATVNTIADRFAAISIELKESGITEVREELAKQLSEAEVQLQEAEERLREFRVANSMLPLERMEAADLAGERSYGSGLQSTYFDLQYERDRVRRDRVALEQLLQDVEDPVRMSALLQAIPTAASSPVLEGLQTSVAEQRQALRTLMQDYTEDHPDIQDARADLEHLENVEIPNFARGLAQALADRERQLDAAIGDRTRQLREVPAASADDARLQRTALLASELYSTLKQRYEEARLAAASTVADVRILDRASIARRPISDNRIPVVLFSFFASLGIGVAGVLVYDRLDPRIRYPEEVTRGMGLSILGTIPHLPLGHAGSDAPDLEVAAEAMEAFRGLRLNLSYAYGAAGPLVTAVTSPGPGEGKSFVSMNLALSFARVGYRTLLIDGDVRRGRLHRTLQFPRRPGLTDYLLEECGVEQLVRHTSHDGLDIMPCGIRKQDAPELLATNRLGELMTKLRRDYQVIIVDTPPLGAGVDPLIFGVATGSLLLVLRAGSSVRGLTENRLEHMSRLPLRILGAVMNDVPPSASYPYYYSYLSDYSPTEESDKPSLIGT